MLLPTLLMSCLLQVYPQTSNKYLHQKLLESWDGFPDGPGDQADDSDNGGEIVIDFYSDLVKAVKNKDVNDVRDDNIIILPFFSDEELTLRLHQNRFSLLPTSTNLSVQNIHGRKKSIYILIYYFGFDLFMGLKFRTHKTQINFDFTPQFKQQL